MWGSRPTIVIGTALLLASVLLPRARAEEAGASEPAPIDYQRDVRPLLSAACFQCHGPDAQARQADLRLDVADGGALDDRGGYRVIEAGRPEESELIRRITHPDPDVRMPPAGHARQLSAEEVDVLRRWVAEGATWTAHWAFVPPRRPALPNISQSAWPRNDMDRFVLAELERHGLSPSPEADRVTLLRRVTLDLTGLPPTPQEADAFLTDTAEDAYERLVDRLLDSPRYGERMAVDWLDAARYADTNGYQVDRDRDMWPWRDWVVEAFNRNLPFDQFTIEQFAGDLLPEPTLAQRIATGLHRNHLLNEEGGVIPEEFLAEYIADRVETTGTVWLGLTLGCARCHDHKYDPVSQKDFFSLYAFFHNVPEKGIGDFGARPNKSAPPLLRLPSPEQEHRLDELAAAIADLEARLAAPVADVATAGEQADSPPAEAKGDPAADAPTGDGFAADGSTKTGGQGDGGVDWKILKGEWRSAGEASFALQPDGSVLVSGPNPPTDAYTLAAEAPIAGLAVLRLEALPDDSFHGNGPGRSVNGNFVLTGVTLTAGDEAVPFQAARADFSQQNFPVADAIDGRPQSGWAVHPELGRAHTAIFVLERPLAAPEGAPLTVVLDFQSPHAQHQLGRFRLAVSDQTPAYESGDAERWKAELADLKKRREAVEAEVPTMMVMEELEEPRPTHVLIRGEYDKPGERVDAETPSALPPFPADLPRNRLGLAKWLLDPDHPLTARVTVNRYWQTFFGAGLVRTAEDFGAQGESPSHPDLLDWLATEFVRSGWDVKAMHRLIVTSATYRQASRVTPELLARDPENRWLARAPRLRLPAEMIRDQALAASGLLVERRGGPPVKPYHPPGLYEQVVYQGGNNYEQGQGADLYRRSLYTYWKRSVPHPAMLLFDAPFRETCTVRRARTSTPLQALNLLNDPTYVEAARFTAQRILREGGAEPESRVAYGFRLLLGRPPQPEERDVLLAGFRQALADFRADAEAAEALLQEGETPAAEGLDPCELAAWTMVASTLLNLDETITRE